MPSNSGFVDEQPHGGGGSGDSGSLVALLQLGGALYDSHQNRKLSRENTDKTIAAEKAEAELAYQRSIEQWNRQNLYNSPQAQMQRFLAAGLNPHLIYGQGNSGNATSMPQYQPAQAQYRYASGNFGAALTSVLPTLMAVGTWMQNMRLGEAELMQKRTNTERAAQMIEYLTQANPKLLQAAQNKLDIFPYQKQTADYGANIARSKLFELEQDFRYKYGEGLFGDMGSAWAPQGGKYSEIGGMKRLQYIQQEAKSRLEQARASWSDFDITNPQAIMQLVLSGVMGLAGQTMRLSTTKGVRSRTTHETESRMSTGRSTIRRRIYER